MPNYEYQCTANGERFELWQEVGADAPPCPSCGAPSKKVFGVPRVIFKGSGFYLTDKRAEQSGGSSGGAKSDSAKSDSSSSGSSDSSSSSSSSSDSGSSSGGSSSTSSNTSSTPASS